MDCSTIKPVVGCWSKADGSFESVSIHYEYATAASGEPIVKSTRYTKADGGNIITVPAGDTVTVGACSSKQPSYRKICAMMDLAGTPTKVNILEVSTPQANGTTVTTYLDPHVSPMVDVTSQFISFENDGKCPCTINGTIPTVTAAENGSQNRITAAQAINVTTAVNPTFTGARDVTVYNGKNVTVVLEYTTTVNGVLHRVNIPRASTWSNTLKLDDFANEGTYVTANIVTAYAATTAANEINVNWTT